MYIHYLKSFSFLVSFCSTIARALNHAERPATVSSSALSRLLCLCSVNACPRALFLLALPLVNVVSSYCPSLSLSILLCVYLHLIFLFMKIAIIGYIAECLMSLIFSLRLAGIGDFNERTNRDKQKREGK